MTMRTCSLYKLLHYVFHMMPSMQDRIPADGVVREGRSSVDESSFTGEPLPVTKLPGVPILS